MSAFYAEIASTILRIVLALMGILLTAVVIPWIKGSAIPWMKEKQLYGLVTKFVHAAEKLAETGAIDRSAKKDYVVSLLKGKGYEITDETEAFIESAVKELDMAVEFGVGEILDAFEDESEDESSDSDDMEATEEVAC